MHSSTFLTTIALFAATGLAGYVLEDDYLEQGFFDQFSFFEGADTNLGFVAYQGRDAANSSSLIAEGTDGIYMGVDHDNNTPDGRPSVRLTSNKAYQSGLIVANITHMPGGICGTWPAFWTVGPNWPNDGEIDIFEGVNAQDSNNITLHTGPNVTISDNDNFSGAMSTTYCGPTSENSGCQINANDEKSYGTGFNAAGGGIYATEWTSTAINIYFFSNADASSAPTDILGSTPDPSTWGKPLASFSGDFDMATAFVDQRIVINTNFCGTWAGNAWASSSCYSEQYQTCDAFVAANPAAFEEAYWQFAGLKVYQSGGESTASSTPTASASLSFSSGAPSSTAPVYSPSSSVAPSSSALASSSASAIASSSSTPTPSSSSTTTATSSSIPSPTFYTAPSSSAPAPTSYASAPSSSAQYTYVSTEVVTATSIVYVTAPAAESTPVASAGGYAPVVGGDGSVDEAKLAAAATTPSSEGWWTTGPDGNAVYGGRKREEQGERRRHARHLNAHRRRQMGA